MSTLGSLMSLLGDTGIKPYNEQELTANRIQSGNLTNQTALLQLEEMRRAQETAARARQYYQEHPEALLGGGAGGPLLASPALTAGGAPMPQQAFGPGGMGPTQQGPAYPDASRYAGVSPQGGGPIPPDVAAQVMPQVTPPGGPQSTIGGLAPRPQANPLEALVRTDPDAARIIQQQQQAQQDRAMNIATTQLTLREKKAAAVGQAFQGVTDQASYGEALTTLREFDPGLVARLPQAYDKDTVQRLVKQAVDVKTSAGLAIQKMQTDAEIGKYNLQLQNAGYQGLGADVTGVLKGLTPEQVQEFGGRTSDKAIAYATKEVNRVAEDLKKKEGLAAAETRIAAEKQARLDKTVSEAFGERTTKLYDTQTGQTVDARTKVGDYEALPAGRVRELSTNQTEQMENVNNSIPIVAQLQTHIDKIYGPGGVLARMTPDERADLAAAPERWAKQYAQKYPELQQAQRFINSNAGALARALAGEKGAMAEGDVARAKEMLPQLETSLQLWPPSKIGIQQPDTRATALRSMNSIVDLINGRVRTLLGNEQFTHPKLHRYETADEAQQATGGPGTPPQVAKPALPIPPTTGLNPNLKPLPPTFGPGDPTQQLRPAPPPAPPPPPPTAGSTKANDEAYRRLMTPPAAAPGRRSAADLPGAPKVANLDDVAEAMRQTGRSRREVEEAMRAKGYRVYGSKLKLPEVTMVG